MIDQAVVEQGVRLTVIGIGIAFAVLLLLTVAITLMAFLVRLGSRIASKGAGAAASPDEVTPDARERALAAVVAVSAMLGRIDRAEADGSGAAEVSAADRAEGGPS